MAEQHVGFMHTTSNRDAEGRWVFDTTTHFRLSDRANSTITKELLFDANYPWPLLVARLGNQSGTSSSNVVAIAEDGGFAVTIEGDKKRETQLRGSFTLQDFVRLETWLQHEAPAPGTTTTAPALDLDKLAITHQRYRVADLNATGYLIEQDAPLAANQIQLDANFRPSHLQVSGTFSFEAANESAAINLDTLESKTDYLLPVDQRLTEHTKLTALNLSVESDVSLDLPATLNLRAGAVTQNLSRTNPDQYTGEELQFPITDARIQTMVQKLLHADSDILVDRLVKHVHHTLLYAENRPAGSVTNALDSGRGECTDFADLFTTLARAANLPARNVYGLVYRDSSQPGFVFHAWNEVYTAGGWRAVDPTWDQTIIDATHLPLDERTAGLVMLGSSRKAVSLSVLSTQYQSES